MSAINAVVQLAADGDIVAIDVRKARETVVFLSHDGDDTDGIVLGRDFDDYLARHAALGGVGLESAQWLPFVSDIDGERILDPDGDAANQWRRWFGLPLRAKAAAEAAAARNAVAAQQANEGADWQRRADEHAPKTVDELRRRLGGVPWCASCGQGPASLDLPYPVLWLSTAKKAKTHLGSNSWSSALLEGNNELSVWLQDNAKDQRRSWNERVDRLKAGLLAELAPSWQKPQEALGLAPDLGSTLQWIVLGAALELEYLPLGHPARFFLNLLPVLEAGHLPCGWKGHWPRGELVLF